MHELEKMKRAQVQQVDEMSIQKLKKNHGTFQQSTSQLQQFQEQMNFMHSSGEFQDIESNYSGRLSHVSSQPEMIFLVLVISLAATKDFRLIHGINPECRKKRIWISIFYV